MAAANGGATVNIRKSAAGLVLIGGGRTTANALGGNAAACHGSGIYRVDPSGGDVTATVVQTLTGIVGNAATMQGSVGNPRWFSIEDFGEFADFPDHQILS
jgi:hypothetical protein